MVEKQLVLSEEHVLMRYTPLLLGTLLLVPPNGVFLRDLHFSVDLPVNGDLFEL